MLEFLTKFMISKFEVSQMQTQVYNRAYVTFVWFSSLNELEANTKINTVGSRFTTGLRSRIFGCKSNGGKMSTIEIFKLR